ncbi:MAG: hypothetical protein QG616_279 [Pseudomonadota bacterium]|nr:hypothetical protein [Pseudomonadota bacterium]MDQ5903101.1 hypothetical protein [Pseudomonadota bacterium]
MKVGHDIAKTGEIDLVRLIRRTKCRFRCEHDPHQPRLIGLAQVAHFACVLTQDDAAKAWVVGICDTHDATEIVFPQELAPGRAT